MAPEPHTEYKYRGTLALHARLHECRAMEQKAFFDVRTMQRSFQPLRSQVSYHQRLVEAIRTNNVPRVATVLNAAKKRVWSYCMAQHYADVHDTARHLDLMHIA